MKVCKLDLREVPNNDFTINLYKKY